MHIDTAKILTYMGYVVDVDFIATQGESNAVSIQWLSQSPQPTQAELDAAALPATKSQRIVAINAECRSRLFARFGEPAEQVSRSLGVYGATEKAALTDGLASTIDASNEASNAVLAATTIPDVEAVTVTWPVI